MFLKLDTIATTNKLVGNFIGNPPDACFEIKPPGDIVSPFLKCEHSPKSLSVLAALVCAIACAAHAADSVSPELEKQFAGLLMRLNDDDWRVREDATRAVIALPPEALPLIESAMRDQNLSPEVQARLERVVGDFRSKAAVSNQTRLREAGLAAYRDFLLVEYDRAGRHDIKWDMTAHEAIVLYAAQSQAQAAGPRGKARVLEQLKKCVDLGCDDPLVRLYFVLQRTLQNDPTLDLFDEADQLTKQMLASQYAPRLKIISLITRARMRANRWPIGEPGLQQLKYIQDLNDAVTLFPQVRGQPEPVEGATISLSLDLMRLFAAAEPTPEHRDAIAAAVAQADARPIAPLLFKAKADLLLSSLAAQKTGALNDYREEALAAASEAAVKDPTSLDAARLRARCVNSQKNPQEFTDACDKALSLNADDYETHQMVLAFIAAQHDDSAVLSYADECLNTNAWTERTPVLGAIACKILAEQMDDEGRREFLASPKVWARVQRGFEGVLRVYPKDTKLRSQYLWCACEGQLWVVADQQFKILGDDVDTEALGGKALADFKRKKAERGTASSTTSNP